MVSKIGSTKDGFTLTELVVVISVVSFIIAGVMSVAFRYFNYTNKGEAKAQLTMESQNILRSFSENIRTGSGLRETNTIADPSGNTWNMSDENNTFILRAPAKNSNNEFIYNEATGYPYQNEIIIFSDGTNLFQRTLANPGADENRSRTTCPEATSDESCPPDELLSENFQDLTFTMYDQDNTVTNEHHLARSVGFELSLSENTSGGNVTNTDIARLTFRNEASE